MRPCTPGVTLGSAKAANYPVEGGLLLATKELASLLRVGSKIPMKSLQRVGSARRVESAWSMFCCEQHSPIAVYQDEQDHRIARCLKCGATSQPQRDVLTARALLIRGVELRSWASLLCRYPASFE